MFWSMFWSMFPRDRGFIFSNVAHTTILKETSSLLRFHFQRRSLSRRSKLIQVSRWPLGLPPRFGCPLCLRRSAMAKRKSGGCRFSKFFVWATFQNLFPVTSKQPSCAKTQTQRQMHSSQWNGVWVFAQLLSYPRAAMSILYMGIFQKSHDFDRLFD